MPGILQNRILAVALAGWFLAQAIKLTVELVRNRRLDMRYFVSAGGMPSAHSALVTSLATAVARQEGMGSPMFAVVAVFAAIVMYDAAGLRQAVSIQARILNQMIDELFKEHALREQRLRELIGHTPVEVAAGFTLGLVVGVLGTL